MTTPLETAEIKASHPKQVARTLTEKERLESLSDLRSFFWASFDKRRTYEFRTCLSLWAVIGGAIALVLRGDASIPGDWPLAVVSAAVFAVHVCFVVGCVTANRLDRKQAFFFVDEALKSLSVALPADVIGAIQHRKHPSVRRNWSPVSQVTVTALLLLVLNLVAK